jgi:type IV fimbrial biogenesis protein FimT
MHHRTRRPQQGLSLVELVVALAIVVLLCGVAAPGLSDFLQASHLTAASGELVTDIEFTRAEALKRNRRVTLCKSAEGDECSTGGGWEQGWIVFHDQNGNGRLDPGEEVLVRHGALAAPLRLVGNQPVASYISYTPVGASKLTSGAFQAGTLTACRQSGTPTPARQVILNAVGRPRVQRATVASCA